VSTRPGGLDPAALGPDAVGAVRVMLRTLGCTDAELDEAEQEGTLPLLAVERLIVPDAPAYDLDAVTDRTGLPAAQVVQLWRTLGYPVPRPGEVAFTDVDMEILARIGRLQAADVATPDLVLQMSRVIGSSMARVASAQVDVISARVSGSPRRGAVAGRPVTDDQIVVSASALLPIVPDVLTAAWRRHLLAAVRRRLSIAEAGHGALGAVGFADLVGFTALSQQVGDDRLASILDQFEQLAFDTVTARGGRVVKMIGDEVMFAVDAPEAAADIALALAAGTHGSEDLSDLRVGMAYGPLLERESDLYGPVVNLASRITGVAFPGAIVIDAALRDRLAEDERYRARPMRPRYLKDFGRVPLWVLRPAAGDERGGGRHRRRGP
jgi:adenylate cyclase